MLLHAFVINDIFVENLTIQTVIDVNVVVMPSKLNSSSN